MDTKYAVGDIVEHHVYPANQIYLILETGDLTNNSKLNTLTSNNMLRYYAINLKNGKTKYFNYLFDIQSNLVW